MVGEGGNLGLTQRGRIEYALRGGPDQSGGRINNDAIDNVAGVNCSDHEVNIKILLDGLGGAAALTDDRRNELLASMTDAVGERVVYGSYTQTQAMSIALAQAVSMRDVHARHDHAIWSGPRASIASSSSCRQRRRWRSAAPIDGDWSRRRSRS